ncbi:PLDc N-terminal domain-containing protein [Chloroflexota bacterium]
MESELLLSTRIAQVVNFIILFSVAFAIAFWVFRDSRKHNMSPPSALAWSTVSLFTFPIGLLIYMFFGRKEKL